MPKIRCQAKDPNTCNYHNPNNVDKKFWVPSPPREGSVLNLLERLKNEKNIEIKYPIRRTFRIQRENDTNTLTSYLKATGLSFSSVPDFNRWQMVFEVTASNEDQLRVLAAIEKEKVVSDNISTYVQLKLKAEDIEKKNAWRKRFKKTLIDEPGLMPFEDWVESLSAPYRDVNIKQVPHIRFI